MVFVVPKSKASIKQNRFEFQIDDKKYSVPLMKFIPGAVVEEMAEAQAVGGAAAMAAGFRMFGAKGTPEGDAVRTLDGEQLDALANAYMEASGITVGESSASTDSAESTERPSDTHLIRLGLRLEQVGSRNLSWVDLRAIVKYAPPDSALVRDLDPDWWVTAEIRLAREIEHNTRVLGWLQSKDGSKGRNYPKRVPLTQAEREAEDGIKPSAMPIHELNEWLGGDFAALNRGGGD